MTRQPGVWLVAAFCAWLLGAACAVAQNTLLYDFEDGGEGWENEAPEPIPSRIVEGRARRGARALGFEFSFGPKSMILHCRTKEGFPRDYSDPKFQGFSAWVYIPSGATGWESFMFARTGNAWTWNKGTVLKGLQPGWHRVTIASSQMSEREMVQDIGVQVINTSLKITAMILIDQVEAIFDEPLNARPRR